MSKSNPPISTFTGLKIASSLKNDPFDALILPSRTNAQMNALKVNPGTIIYNSETNAFMGYVGGNAAGWKTVTVV